MSNLDPARHLSAAAALELKTLADCGSSEAYCLADCLNTIAGNSEEQASDEHLSACAEELLGYALGFLGQIKMPLSDAAIYQLLDRMLRTKAPTELVEMLDQQSRTTVLLMDERFARNAWSVGDVQSLFDVTDDVAASFLQKHAETIRERLTERGWDLLENLGREDGLKLNEPEDFE